MKGAERVGEFLCGFRYAQMDPGIESDELRLATQLRRETVNVSRGSKTEVDQ